MSAAKSSMTPEQARSTDPGLTAWVGASAGTGKTHVLTARVLRLMLIGTPPENIVCLTFTKAAAAEMKNRIFAELGSWTVMDDVALAGVIAARTHETADTAMLERARQLFARVLDLAGGLQIQTFHSFCQSLLGRFPLEAGMTPGFEGIDESDATELMRAAKDKMLAATQEPVADDLQRALQIVAGLVTERTFDEVIDRLVFDAQILSNALRVHGGATGLRTAVYHGLGADPDDSRNSILTAACADPLMEEQALLRLAEALHLGSARDSERGQTIKAFLDASVEDRVKSHSHYRRAFLTAKGTPLKTVATQKVLKADNSLEQVIDDEQQRLLKFEEKLLRHRAATATAALLRLGIEQIGLYRYVKNERGLVDFDDMIDRTVTLFSRQDVAPWILFKLDNQIDHILVDEAQDTNRDQWRVVETLAAEFFSGEAARDVERTIFAVGDAKQSIFSFQRADPAEFVRARDRIFARARLSAKSADNVPLATSFRSGEAVLSLVDQVFAPDGRAYDGVAIDGENIRHRFHRAGHAGTVELWPLEVPKRDTADDESTWQLPLVQESADDAERRCAGRIAEDIKRSIGSRMLEAKGRPVEAGDILVLVRRRTAFVDHLMRALKSLGVPVSGRDRMTLLEELPVMDLINLIQFAVLPDDDLALATLLKSPFIGMSEEQLFELAHDRPGTLWNSLSEQANEERFARAHAFLCSVLAQVDTGGPFDFLSFVLVDLEGRKKLVQRLGNEIHDPVDELLEEALRFQLSRVGSLLNFVETIRRGSSQLKRDMEQAGSRVRIMTVHSAKGLQAPIVYLSDVTSLPDISRDGRLLPLVDAQTTRPVLPVWASHARGLPEIEAARETLRARQLSEYRRLLYVALTRAEDELYVAGWQGATEPSEECWYRLIEDGFDRLGTSHVEKKDRTKKQTYTVPQTIDVSDAGIRPEGIEIQAKAPGWLHQPVTAEPTPSRPISPSQPDEEPAVASPLLRSRGNRFQRGVVIHQLLQWLPDVPAENRASAARLFLSRFDGVLDHDAQEAFLQEALQVVEHPEFGRVFGSGSRAEVPVAGVVQSSSGGVARTVSGQVDRLIVTDTEVIIVDYKTNRPSPIRIEEVSVAYLRQMGLYARILASIYPDLNIVTLLLWTDDATLMELPSSLLEAALKEIGL